MAATNSAPFLIHSSSRRSSSSCSLAPHLTFASFRIAQLGFESKISAKNLEWKGRTKGKVEQWQSKTRKEWGVRCTAEGIDGGMLMGGRTREEGVTVSIPERFKVVFLVACVMCLCNADRVVMSVAVVPLAAKYGWSSSFLGIVQVLQMISKLLIMNKRTKQTQKQ